MSSVESRTYTVTYGWGDYQTFNDFESALAFYRNRQDASIHGDDGYDCDCDEDGFFCCDDGLTEEQRDRLDE